MTIPSKLFLYDSDPRKNLEILADFRFSNAPASTKCLTEAAYKKVPRTNVSVGALREMTIVASAFTVFAAPFALYIAKSAECYGLVWDGEFTKSSECWKEQTGAFGKQVNTMRYLYFISVVAAIGTTIYGGAQWFFQDRNQNERFLMLDKVYTAAANSLVDQYGAAKNEEKKEILKTARKIADNCELINISLCNVARISSPQSQILTEKLSRAAASILNREELAEKRTPSPLLSGTISSEKRKGG